MPSEERGPEPLGPETITWRYFGDWRSLPLALWAGSMQNMHPGLGAGVEQHSRFFEERWERLFRSLYPIGGVVYDGPGARRTAHQVRDYHRTVKGVDAEGRRYSALEPETWFWAHATFVMLPVLITDHFDRPLTPEQKEAYYQEALRWYRLYGVSDRAAPRTWAGFEEYFDRMCREVLEDNRATRAVLDVSRLGPPPSLRRLPDAVWAVLRRPATAPMAWLAVGLWPEPVRQRLGYRWTRRDAVLLWLLGRVVAGVWRLVPFRLRYHPRARAGWARARGEAVPPPETPEKYLPPRARRGEPTHYVPERYRPAGRDGG
ncbi:oxygenase MpaB family protein [Phaeacidiphilus oryzae]|uniref:oxygenase MpaB family protein n=1 Tax=Phaeacidiphilus oryzae TaxID=348818 RepID=UPI00056041A2|nr:oxygenase MpaB family protein [Phaeacidiphilus oryzae]